MRYRHTLFRARRHGRRGDYLGTYLLPANCIFRVTLGRVLALPNRKEVFVRGAAELGILVVFEVRR